MRLLTHTLDSRLVYVTPLSYRGSTVWALCTSITEAHIYEHELFVTFLYFHQGSLVAFLDNSIITQHLHVSVSFCLTIHKSGEETRKFDPDRNVYPTGAWVKRLKFCRNQFQIRFRQLKSSLFPLTFVHRGLIDNNSALVLVMAWHEISNTQFLSEPIMTQRHIGHKCVVRPQHVVILSYRSINPYSLGVISSLAQGTTLIVWLYKSQPSNNPI